jgi:hypothetical protein
MNRAISALQPVLLLGFLYCWINTLQSEIVLHDPYPLCIDIVQTVILWLAFIFSLENSIRKDLSTSASVSYILIGTISVLLPVLLLMKAIAMDFSLGFLSALVTAASVLHYCFIIIGRE